jgi:hypothetical protein
MKRDKAEIINLYQRGDILTSDGPTVPFPLTRRDYITKGAFLTLDCPVVIKSAPALPDLAPIAQRMDELQARIEALLHRVRS